MRRVLLSLDLAFNPCRLSSDKPGMGQTTRNHRIRTIFSLVLAIGVFSLGVPAVAGQLSLAPALTSELNHVLNISDVLHRSLVEQNEEQTEISLREMVIQLGRARAASFMAKPHDRRHLLRILDAAHEHFELTQSSYGDERRARLEEGFNQLANLVRVYRLDQSFGIFFCPKDRTTWIQKGYKARSPFRSKQAGESCGIRVSR